MQINSKIRPKIPPVIASACCNDKKGMAIPKQAITRTIVSKVYFEISWKICFCKMNIKETQFL